MSKRGSLRSHIRLATVVLRDPGQPWYGRQLSKWSGIGESEVSFVLADWADRGLIEEIDLDPYTAPLRFLLLHDRGCHWKQLTPLGRQELGSLVDHVRDVLTLLITRRAD